MHSICHFVAVALLLVGFVGCDRSAPSPEKTTPDQAKTPDEQITELLSDYALLSNTEQEGPKGEELINKMKSFKGNVSDEAKEKINRLDAARNLRQIAIVTHTYSANPIGVDIPMNPLPGPVVLEFPPGGVLPFLEQGSIYQTVTIQRDSNGREILPLPRVKRE